VGSHSPGFADPKQKHVLLLLSYKKYFLLYKIFLYFYLLYSHFVGLPGAKAGRKTRKFFSKSGGSLLYY